MKVPTTIESRPSRGTTLIEMTVVLLIVLALVSAGLFVTPTIQAWQLGRNAGETLRLVYAAQRAYLADNPTVAVSSITAANLIPYLPNNASSMPTVTSLTGTTLSIIVNVSPPVVNAGNGTTYDPSGSPNDGLWDVGQ